MRKITSGKLEPKKVVRGEDINSFVKRAYSAEENMQKKAKAENKGNRQKPLLTYASSEGAKISALTIQKIIEENLRPLCDIPKLNPFDEAAMKYVKDVKKLQCPKKYFSRVEGQYLIATVENVTDAYIQYINRLDNNDDKILYSEQIPLLKDLKDTRSNHGSLRLRYKLLEDFVKITIIKDGKTYEEYHAAIITKDNVIMHAKTEKKGMLQYNVLLLMIDSQSASNVKRKLKRVYDYLTKDDDSFIFEGQSIVGDGTTAQLSALLTGAFEWDFPESRRGFAGGKPIDDWPFIFKNFKQQGYATMFNEDDPIYGTFNYRLHGFKNKPTDHYGRPFWLSAKGGACHGDNPIFIRSLDYLRDFHDNYNSISKFSLSVLSAMFHDDLNRLSIIDDDLLKFIKDMKNKGHLNDTIFILFGDHGVRFAGFRETITGKLEERLPFLSITLPKKFTTAYPKIKRAMQHNTKVLTSFFDIHATLKHILTYPSLPKVKIGQSLFEIIPPDNRTCKTAGIKEHWCPCLQLIKRNTADKEIISIAEAVVDYINVNLTGNVLQAKSMCAVLKLDRIKRAGQRMPNEKVRKFRQTSQNSKCIECDVILGGGEKFQENSKEFELVLSVEPSHAVFEVYVTVKSNSTINTIDISRLDKYGDQPKCIQDEHPSLRKYCYCIF